MRKGLFILALGIGMGCRGGVGPCGPNAIACIFLSGGGASARVQQFGTSVAQSRGAEGRLVRVAAAAPQATQDDNARKARTLLDQMVEAMGGNAWRNIQDVSQEGKTYGFSHNGESSEPIPFWRFAKPPDRERIELTKQRDVIEIHNGEQGWEITFKGTAPEDPEPHAAYLIRRNFTMEKVLLGWLKEPGTALFYEGQALADRRQAEKVTVMNAQDEAVTFYIDSITHLPIKKSFEHRDPTSRELDTEDEVYSNWHTVQGIATAHVITRMRNGRNQNQRFLSKVTYNSGLADSLFEAQVNRPAPKK